MKKEYKLTIEIDDELFNSIDIPHYSGPYHNWLHNRIFLALHEVHGFPSALRIEELKPRQLAAIQFADVIIKGENND